MKDSTKFTHELIKGRIAETLFEMMFRDTERFTVHRFGYEYTAPLVAQYQDRAKLQKVLDSIRHTPDFILIDESEKLKGIYIVEVKYQHTLDKQKNLEIASKMLDVWDPSHLFIVSQDGFYYDPANTIVFNHGEIRKLSTTLVPFEIQERYRVLAKDYFAGH